MGTEYCCGKSGATSWVLGWPPKEPFLSRELLTLGHVSVSVVLILFAQAPGVPLNIFIFYFSKVLLVWIVLFYQFSASMIQLCVGCIPFGCHL